MRDSSDDALSPARSHDRSPVWWIAAAMLALAVAAHLFAVVAYLTIPSPTAPTVRAAVDAYVVPYFTQDWRLFAPLPDAHDYAAYARGFRRDGDEMVPTPWVDLLDPLVAAVQANRLSGEGVTLEAIHKATLLTAHAVGPRAIFADSRAALVTQWADVELQPASLVVLESAAASLLAVRYPNVDIESVQVMVGARRVLPLGAEPGPEDAVTIIFEPIPTPRVAAWPR